MNVQIWISKFTLTALPCFEQPAHLLKTSRERKTVTALCYARLLTKQKIIELYVYQLNEIWFQIKQKLSRKESENKHYFEFSGIF